MTKRIDGGESGGSKGGKKSSTTSVPRITDKPDSIQALLEDHLGTFSPKQLNATLEGYVGDKGEANRLKNSIAQTPGGRLTSKAMREIVDLDKRGSSEEKFTKLAKIAHDIKPFTSDKIAGNEKLKSSIEAHEARHRELLKENRDKYKANLEGSKGKPSAEEQKKLTEQYQNAPQGAPKEESSTEAHEAKHKELLKENRDKYKANLEGSKGKLSAEEQKKLTEQYQNAPQGAPKEEPVGNKKNKASAQQDETSKGKIAKGKSGENITKGEQKLTGKGEGGAALKGKEGENLDPYSAVLKRFIESSDEALKSDDTGLTNEQKEKKYNDVLKKFIKDSDGVLGKTKPKKGKSAPLSPRVEKTLGGLQDRLKELGLEHINVKHDGLNELGEETQINAINAMLDMVNSTHKGYFHAVKQLTIAAKKPDSVMAGEAGWKWDTAHENEPLKMGITLYVQEGDSAEHGLNTLRHEMGHIKTHMWADSLFHHYAAVKGHGLIMYSKDDKAYVDKGESGDMTKDFIDKHICNNPHFEEFMKDYVEVSKYAVADMEMPVKGKGMVKTKGWALKPGLNAEEVANDMNDAFSNRGDEKIVYAGNQARKTDAATKFGGGNVGEELAEAVRVYESPNRETFLNNLKKAGKIKAVKYLEGLFKVIEKHNKYITGSRGAA